MTGLWLNQGEEWITYSREMTFLWNLFDSTLYFSPFRSRFTHPFSRPPAHPSHLTLSRTFPIGARLNLTSAKFPVHGKRGALFFESGFRRVGLQSASTLFSTARSPPPPLLASPSSIPHVHVHTYKRSLSLYFSRERNEIGAIARFHLQSGTKLSMLNLIS